MDKGILYVMTTAVSGLIKRGKTETKRHTPALWVCLLSSVGIFGKFVSTSRQERPILPYFQVSGSSSSASRTLPLPRLTQIYKTFRNLWGRVWGNNAPHTKKGLRFYSKSLNFLGVPKGIFL